MRRETGHRVALPTQKPVWRAGRSRTPAIPRVPFLAHYGSLLEGFCLPRSLRGGDGAEWHQSLCLIIP